MAWPAQGRSIRRDGGREANEHELTLKKARMWVSSRRSRLPLRNSDSKGVLLPMRFAKSEAFLTFSHFMLRIHSMSAHMLA